MQSLLPTLGRALRCSSKRSPARVASVVGVTVSRLHALVVIARLRRKGITSEMISAIAAPGAIPEGVLPDAKNFASPPLRVAGGQPVEITGALRERFLADETESLEGGLQVVGAAAAQTSTIADAIRQGHVVLWIEVTQGDDLSVILDVFEANGVSEVLALPFSGARACRTSGGSSDSSASDAGLPGALMA
jgi:hypothetical protein